jgi:hypothetical protein
MPFVLRETSDRPARVNARLKENLDAEDVTDTGDHLLIQKHVPDFSWRLFL